MRFFLSIDYDEFDQDSYRACVAETLTDDIVCKFASGNPVTDWNRMMELLKDENWIGLSSCDHFLMDGNKYNRDENNLLYEVEQ